MVVILIQETLLDDIHHAQRRFVMGKQYKHRKSYVLYNMDIGETWTDDPRIGSLIVIVKPFRRHSLSTTKLQFSIFVVKMCFMAYTLYELNRSMPVLCL